MYKKVIRKYMKKHGFGEWSPKAVLFDMDGVLYDSMPNHALAWKRSMELFGIKMSTADAYATEGARGIDTIRNMVKGQQNRDITLEEAQTMYDEKTRQFHLLPETQVMPGVKELMEQIKASGLTIGVVTGSGQRPLINRLLVDFGEYLMEEHITTAYDVDFGKPAPTPYLVGMQKCGNLMPWETIVVENSPLGIQAGVAAQALTIAVNTGPLPNQVLLECGADILFPKMIDLSNAWQKLYTERPEAKLQEAIWERQYLDVMAFMEENKRRPSKHRPEDRSMSNWIKHNKKLMNQGKLAPWRIEKFQILLKTAAQYRRINQHAYLTAESTD